MATLQETDAFSDSELSAVVESLIGLVAKTFSSSGNPRAVILGGQPGAGKSALHTAADPGGKAMVVINGDDYRRHHPRFAQINEAWGADSPDHTQVFSNAVTESMINRLSDLGYDLIIEEPCAHRRCRRAHAAL